MINEVKGKFDVVVFSGTVLHSTAKATLIEVDEEKLWFPNSQFKKPTIQPNVDNHELPNTCTCFIPRWLAEEKEIDYTEEQDWEDSMRDWPGGVSNEND